MRKGHPIVYKFSYFPEEYGVIKESVIGERNVYIVYFPFRKDVEKQEQKICTGYLREPYDHEKQIILDKISADAKKPRTKYPMIDKAIHKGILYVKKGSVCSFSHLDLQNGEEVIILNDSNHIYSREWIESYWNYIDEITDGKCPPRNPITNVKVVCQDTVERFTVRLYI